MIRILITITFTIFFYGMHAQEVVIDGDLKMGGKQIKEVADPSDAQDVATKNYTYSKAEVDEIVAEMQNQINVLKIANLPQQFTKKAVIDNFTGTWCPYCPNTAYAYELVAAQSNKVFRVEVHNGDPMTNVFATQLEEAFNITGWPTSYINRSYVWTFPQANNVDQALNAAQGNTNLGLAIASTLTGAQLEIKVTSGFLENKTNLKLVVLVLENQILNNQENYTPHYGGEPIISNFEHNDALRYAATNILGDPTPSTIGEHKHYYNVALDAYGVLQPSKTAILAMLLNENGVLLNAQYAAVNQTQNFD